MGDPSVTWADAVAPLRERGFAWYFASRFVNTLGVDDGQHRAGLRGARHHRLGRRAGTGARRAHDPDDPAAAVGRRHLRPVPARRWCCRCPTSRRPPPRASSPSWCITGTAELWMLIALTAVHGAVSAISFPAMASMVPQLVPRAQLQPANALLSLTRNGLTVLGPTTGALLVVTLGVGLGTGRRRGDVAALRAAAASRQDARAGEEASRPAPSPSCARAGRSSGPPPGCGRSCSASASST